jgi:hypothetical protein
LAAKRVVAAGLVAVGLLGLVVGVATRRMRWSGAPSPGSARDAAAGDAAPRAAHHPPDAAADALRSTAPDLVAASAAIAARLYQCWPASQWWRAGRSALGKFELSEAGALVRGMVLPAQIDEGEGGHDGGSGAFLAAHRACFDGALTSGAADAGATATTVWFPLSFAKPAGPDGGVAQAPPREPPAADILAVPMYYPRSDLPRDLQGDWLGLCGGGEVAPWPPGTISRSIEERRPPSWRPATLSRIADEENEDFDDVKLDGCEAKERLVPVVRGAVITRQPAPARVAAGPRTALGERNIRFGKRRFQIWQDKISEEASLIVLAFDGQLQVLLPDSMSDDFAVVWAGDLDGDHRLDLVIADDEVDEPRFTLFLSSSASRALPVGRVSDAQVPGD